MTEFYDPEIDKRVQKLMMKKDDIVKKLNQLRRGRK
jgi:hypothetical protein